MGKGGENAQMKKLAGLQTAELRKWAVQYGVDKAEKLDRPQLEKELVGYADGIFDRNRQNIQNLPLAKPKFTLKTIRDAIPAHCFKRSLSRSMMHLFEDLAKISLLGWLATHISSLPTLFPTMPLPPWVVYVAWPVYWYLQGCVMTGLWVLAHECGHQAFSDYEWVNNTIGTIFHSALLVPYHPWRITHGRHHNNTGSCDNDEVFAPSVREDWKDEALRTTPIGNWWGIFVMLTFGWWPGYLIFNATGPAKYRGKNVSHLSPTAVFIDPKDHWLVVQSDIALFTCFALLGYSIYVFGFTTVGAYYIIPEMIVNLHLVLITYLQHTDVYMPHFRNAEWNWLRGALCTIDRQFGPLGWFDRTLHHITDTHVCHHLFSTMPFYHAQEATPHIKRVLGDFYKRDDTPIPFALYRAFSCCQFVENEGDTVFYKNVK